MTDEYIRKADAADTINANADDLEQNGGIPFAQGARAMAIVVEQMQPADVAPVVRCKDCLFFTTEKSCCRPEGLIKAREDDFCSYGERKE